MTRYIRPLAFLIIVSAILVSCNIGRGTTPVAPIIQQATPTVIPPTAPVVTAVLTLTTSANPTTYDQVGREITLTYVIKNSGTTTVGPAQFTVTDSLIGATPFNCGDPNTILPPNGTVTCTQKYTVKDADLGSVSITNVATAAGGGAAPSQTTSTTINKGPVVTSNPANLTPGSTISHTVIDGEWIWQIGRCYGVDPTKIIAANRQLADPAQISPKMILTVPNIGSAGTIYGPPCVETYTVKSGDTWASIAQLYNADPNIMQMVNRNSLTVGSKVYVPKNSAGATTPSTGSKVLSLTTSANPTSYDQAGQEIIFTYVIKNSGTTTLGPAQFKITDTLITNTPFDCGSLMTLPPAATVTCSAKYTVQQADLNVVSITNVATASGGGAGTSQTASATVNKAVKALTLTTSANPQTYDAAGQQITFSYVIKNSGGATIGPTQFTVTDTLIGAAPFNCGVPNTTLAPGATVTCNATPYVITQNDMGAVSVSNVATASGGGVGPTQTASATVTKAVRSLGLTTVANPQTYNQAGQQITFMYVIKNTGTVSLGPTQFTVTDTLMGTTPFNCGDPNSTLAPNAMITCSKNYTIQPADLNSVSITNVATASGGGVGPSPAASATVTKQ